MVCQTQVVEMYGQRLFSTYYQCIVERHSRTNNTKPILIYLWSVSSELWRDYYVIQTPPPPAPPQ